MKKYLLFFLMLSILSNCMNPEERPWIIPLTIDDTLLDYTPEHLESFQKRRSALLDKMEPGFLILSKGDSRQVILSKPHTNLRIEIYDGG